MRTKLPLITLLYVSALPIQAQSAPVPAELATATSVFISNGGGEYNSRATQAASARYTGGPDRPYDEFYTAMHAWGHYALVSTPASADLSMEIRFAMEVVPDFNMQHAYDAWDPALRVVVRDVKTQTVLWTVTEHVHGVQDKDFDAAMGQMMIDLKKLAGAT
jgi:hypothetical protein